ncbi:MAG: CHAD domain-containing protein [Candidatus Bathyarchaeia archaeon]
MKDLTFSESALCVLPKTLEEFYAHNPEDLSPHSLHMLRISAKKLRYTLELFETCYGDRLETFIASIKELQEILGDIHDCDVMIDFLHKRVQMLLQSNRDLLGSIAAVLSRLETQRIEMAARFKEFWKQNIGEGFRERLREVINSPTSLVE